MSSSSGLMNRSPARPDTVGTTELTGAGNKLHYPYLWNGQQSFIPF